MKLQKKLGDHKIKEENEKRWFQVQIHNFFL